MQDKFHFKVSYETVRRSIKIDLSYYYKKVYYRSYSKDEEKIIYMRFYLTFELFEKNYFKEYFMIWMDESPINNTSFVQKIYSKKQE